MDWLSALNVGLKGLAVHKVRAMLSTLGIIFGVASVVAVIAVSQGAQGEMLKQLAAMGANNVIVDSADLLPDKKKAARLKSEGLNSREAAAAASLCGASVESYAPLRRVNASVSHEGTTIDAGIAATTSSFLDVMGFKLREGRWFNPAEEASSERVCVLEDAVRKDAFPLESPIGKKLILDHEEFTVIGVLESKEETDEKYSVVDIKSLNRRIYIPLSTALSRITRDALSDEVQQVYYKCRTGKEVYAVANLLEQFYQSAHGMEGFEPKHRDYTVKIARDLLKKIEDAQNIFNVVMLCSAGISLVVGGIGIMNIMLANVSERRREVGIRRAVGATKSDILKQFLGESLIICLAGGLLGCVVGVIFTLIVANRTGWQTELAPWGMIVAVGVSLVDGVIFGTFPAWKAAQLDPIEALQYE